MEYTLYTKAEIAQMIEDGIPADTSIYYFNAESKAVGGKLYLTPLVTTTFGSIASDDACFIGVKAADVTPEPDPDTQPLYADGARNADIFFNIDTTIVQFFDEDNNKWVPESRS